MNYVEGCKFQRLNYPDPFGYGDKYRPIFPPRHHTMKAVLDNLPSTVEKVYVFGSSIRWDSAVNSDLDLLLIGSIRSTELANIMRAIPDDEKADFLVETWDNFLAGLDDDFSSLYRKIYEGGYKIYEHETK